MAEEEQARDRSKRRDPARNARRDLPVIEGVAQDVTPTADPIVPAEALPDTSSPPESASTGSDTIVTPAVEDGATEAPGEHPNVSGSGEQSLHPDRPSSPDPIAPAPLQGSRSILGTLTAAGFAVLAAGLIYLFTQLPSAPTDNPATVADLKARVAALEARPSTDPAGLSDRIAKVEQDIGDARGGIEAVGKRVDGLAATASTQPDLAGQIADLRTAAAGQKTDLAAVTSSVAALPRPDLGAIDARFGDVNQKLAGLQGAVSSIPHVDLGPLTSKVDGIEARLKPIEAEASAAQSPAQVAQRRAAPVAVTAQAISGAIEAGQAFPDELKALQALGVDPVKLAPLKAVAENGAPSLRELQASLSDLRERVVTQGAPPVSGSYVDRLVAGASSLVQVRPLGSVVGDTPAAIAARMNDAIGNDDLTSALQEWHKLPEPSQSASKALSERITVRLDAERAAKTIASEAIAAMAAARG